MTTRQDHIDRANRRAAPHLSDALDKMLGQGMAPADAAQAMILYGAGVLGQRMAATEASAAILQDRDLLFRWMTDLAAKAAQHPPVRH